MVAALATTSSPPPAAAPSASRWTAGESSPPRSSSRCAPRDAGEPTNAPLLRIRSRSMSRLRGLAAMLRAAIGRRAAESRMHDEFRFHLEMETEQLRRSGLATDEAQRRALVRFGGVERHKEDMRDGRGARWLE